MFERLHLLATEKSNKGFQGTGSNLNNNRLPFGVEALVYPTIRCGTAKSASYKVAADKNKGTGEQPQILVITSYLLPLEQNTRGDFRRDKTNNNKGFQNNNFLSGDKKRGTIEKMDSSKQKFGLRLASSP